MATYNIGQIAIVNKGAWSSSASYVLLNTVTHNGGSFMAIASNSNVEPGVTAGWASSWVPMAKGIKTVTVTALDASTAQVTITLSDGSSIVGGTYNTATVGNGTINHDKLATDAVETANIKNGTVTADKLAADILPANVGIKYGSSVPTTSDISSGQIYFKYEA